MIFYNYDKNYTLFNTKNQGDTKYNYNDLIAIISNNTFLSVAVYYDLNAQVMGGEFFQADLPTPSLIFSIGRYYILSYAITGKPETQEAKEFFKELQERICLTITQNSTAFKTKPINAGFDKHLMIEYLKEAKHTNDVIYSNNKYGMRYLSKFCVSLPPKDKEAEFLAFCYVTGLDDFNKFSDIKEKKRKKVDNKDIVKETKKDIDFYEHLVKNIFKKITTLDKTQKILDDYYFDVLRHIAYSYFAYNKTIDTDTLYQLGLEAGVPEKTDKGKILKYKSEAIVKWIEKHFTAKNINNWEYKRKTKNDKELEMTRKENMIKLNEKKFNEARKKIMNMITGMFANEYKKKNGTWNIMKLSKDLKMSRTTITKHLKLLKEEGII